MPRRPGRRPPGPASPAAIQAANQAALAEAYGLQWSVPAGAPVGPVAGEADYVRHVADLLSGGDAAAIPRGAAVRVLDLCAGAGCLRPLIGAAEYGWRFVATNREQSAHRWGRQIVRVNRGVARLIEGRHQPDPVACLAHVTTAGERFAACLYDPAAEGEPARESERLERLIDESAARPGVCGWFTARATTRAASRRAQAALAHTSAHDVREIAMGDGPARGWVLAWTWARHGA